MANEQTIEQRYDMLLRLAQRMHEVYRRSKMNGGMAFTRYCQDSPAAFVEAVNADRAFFGNDSDDEDFGEMVKHLREDEEEACKKMSRLVENYRDSVEGKV